MGVPFFYVLDELFVVCCANSMEAFFSDTSSILWHEVQNGLQKCIGPVVIIGVLENDFTITNMLFGRV